eukprot:g1875.t1
MIVNNTVLSLQSDISYAAPEIDSISGNCFNGAALIRSADGSFAVNNDTTSSHMLNCQRSGGDRITVEGRNLGWRTSANNWRAAIVYVNSVQCEDPYLEYSIHEADSQMRLKCTLAPLNSFVSNVETPSIAIAADDQGRSYRAPTIYAGCPKNYVQSTTAVDGCSECESGKFSSGPYDVHCEDCKVGFMLTRHCEFPVLGIILILAILALLSICVATIVRMRATNAVTLKTETAREQQNRALQRLLVFKEKRIQRMQREFNEGWKISWSDISMGRKIGSGAEGDVYEATLQESMHVAVKLLRRNDVDTSDFVGSSDEIGFLMQTRHPRLVMFLGCGSVSTGSFFIVSEYVSGGNLADALWETPKIALAQRLQFACDISEGCQYLHSHFKLHRDLKSKNILVTDARALGLRRAKIADFGHSAFFSKRDVPDVLSLSVRSRNNRLEGVSSMTNISSYGAKTKKKPKRTSTRGSGGRKHNLRHHAVSASPTIGLPSPSDFAIRWAKSSAKRSNSISMDDSEDLDGSLHAFATAPLPSNLMETNASAEPSSPAKSTKRGDTHHWEVADPQAIAGTVAYFAPEIARVAVGNTMFGTVGSASDVYAFGVVLAELITQMPPWQIRDNKNEGKWKGISAKRVCDLTIEGQRPFNFLCTAPDSIEGRYIALCQRCWAQHPHDRPTFRLAYLTLREMLSDATVLHESEVQLLVDLPSRPPSMTKRNSVAERRKFDARISVPGARNCEKDRWRISTNTSVSFDARLPSQKSLPASVLSRYRVVPAKLRLTTTEIVFARPNGDTRNNGSDADDAILPFHLSLRIDGHNADLPR